MRLDELEAMTLEAIAALPVDELADLVDELVATVVCARRAQAKIGSAMMLRANGGNSLDRSPSRPEFPPLELVDG